MFNTRLSIFPFASLIILCLSVIFVTDQTSRAMETTMVSISSSRRQGNDISALTSISSYGRFVVFGSFADNLVPNDTNNKGDIFFHDLWTGETSRVSLGNDGAEGNGSSYGASLSEDGRFVAFASDADNLVPNDNNGVEDVFVRDRLLGTTERVSVSTSGAEGNDWSETPHISPDGTFVVFESLATNLSPYDANVTWDIYLHDRGTGETILVSQPSGASGPAKGGVEPKVSADGGLVVFRSGATDLVPGFTTYWNIYIRDISAQTTAAVSRTASGSEPNGFSWFPSMTGDGKYVAFHSTATDLVPGDMNDYMDVFVYDRNSHQTTRASVSSTGAEGNDNSQRASISSDGNYVAFVSSSSNLVSGVSGQQIYIRDRNSGETYLASSNSKGDPANAACSYPEISTTGREVVYESNATNLFRPDSNKAKDVFLCGMNERFVGPSGTDAGSCEDRTSPCRTIQYAVDASRNGDVIKLAQGAYYTGFTVLGGRQTVHLEGGWNSDFSVRDRDASFTVIDYHSARTVVWCSTTNKRLSLKLSGLTVRHGYDSGDRGGGITLTNLGGFLELVLENVRIVDNQSEKGGGLVADTGGSGALTRIHFLGTQVLDNWATLSGGGGVYVRTSAGAKTEVYVNNSVLAGNYGVLSGGAFEVVGDGFSVLEILNSTIMANTASQHGGGIHSAGSDHVWVSNSIVWGNDQVNTFPGEDIWLTAPSYVHTAYCDLGNVVNDTVHPGTYADGGNNFNTDPQVRDIENRDFHLKGGSPAVGKGLCGSWFLDLGSGQWLYSREAPYFDLDDQRRPEFSPSGVGLCHLGCDVGADEFLFVFPPIYLLLLP